MPATYFVTLDGRKVPIAEAPKNPEWFGDLDEELLEWLADSAVKDQYADITVTQLIDPVQITVMSGRHKYSLRPEDVLEAAIGRRFHGRMEAMSALKKKKGLVVEQPMIMKIDGVTVGGTPDKLYYDAKQGCDVLVSRKVRRVYWWKWLQKGVPVLDEPRLQESMYAHLARHGTYLNGGKKVKRNPKRAVLQFLLRDWVKREWEQAQEKGQEYPPPFGTVEIPLMDDDDVAAYIHTRLELWKAAKRLPDNELPECNDEERWKTTRCKYFCPVSEFCIQWRSEAVTGL